MLIKLWLEFAFLFVFEPNGMWLPPPLDCIKMVEDPKKRWIVNTWHDPRVCLSECKHGLHIGYLK